MCFINWVLGGAAGAWYTCSLRNWHWRRLCRIFTAHWIPHHQNSICFLMYFLNLNVHRAASSSGLAHTPLRELVSAQSCVGICSSIFMGLAVCTGTLSCWDREAVTKKLQIHFICLSLYQSVDSGVHLFQVRVLHVYDNDILGKSRFAFLLKAQEGGSTGSRLA